jgi:hypothetical protein
MGKERGQILLLQISKEEYKNNVICGRETDKRDEQIC